MFPPCVRARETSAQPHGAAPWLRPGSRRLTCKDPSDADSAPRPSGMRNIGFHIARFPCLPQPAAPDDYRLAEPKTEREGPGVTGSTEQHRGRSRCGRGGDGRGRSLEPLRGTGDLLARSGRAGRAARAGRPRPLGRDRPVRVPRRSAPVARCASCRTPGGLRSAGRSPAGRDRRPHHRAQLGLRHGGVPQRERPSRLCGGRVGRTSRHHPRRERRDPARTKRAGPLSVPLAEKRAWAPSTESLRSSRAEAFRSTLPPRPGRYFSDNCGPSG